jgi:hypothetical protein
MMFQYFLNVDLAINENVSVDYKKGNTHIYIIITKFENDITS